MMYPWLQSLILTSTLHFAYTLADPITHKKDSLLIRQAPEGPDLHGIYFADGDSKCSAKQRRIIERTFHNMRDFATPAAEIFRDEQQSRDPLFLKFFGDGWDTTLYRQVRYTEIGYNLRKVAEFATDGIDSEYGDRNMLENRLTIRCDDVEKRCPRGSYVFSTWRAFNSRAHLSNTLSSRVAYTNDGKWYGLKTTQWHTNFCPVFFDQDHAVDRAQKTKTPNLISLMTREHIILHEMLHAEIIRFPKHDSIVDVVVANLGRRKEVAM